VIPSDDTILQTRAERLPDPEEDLLTTEDRAELAAYRDLYAALRDEPDFALPRGFGEELASRAFRTREPVWEWFAPVAVLLAASAALVATHPARGAMSGALGVIQPGAQGALSAALPAVTSFLNAVPLSLPLLVLAGLAASMVFLADRLIGPAINHLVR